MRARYTETCADLEFENGIPNREFDFQNGIEKFVETGMEMEWGMLTYNLVMTRVAVMTMILMDMA